MRRLCHQPRDGRVRRERERGLGGRARQHDRARVGPREDLVLDACEAIEQRAGRMYDRLKADPNSLIAGL